MPSFYKPVLAVSLSNIGISLSMVVILGGLAWLLVRAIKGKEVNRRLIFLFIFVAVSMPILFPIQFEETPTKIVMDVFEKMESLPEGSRVLLSYDFDPAMAPEVQPMADAFTRHALVKGHRIIYMCLFATGQGQLAQTFEDVITPEFPDIRDGVDYVNFGYKAGNEGVLNVIITDFKKMFPTDVNGVPYDEMEIMNRVQSVKDIDFVISIGGGRPGIKEWILFVGDPGNVPTAGGVAAVVAPQLYPYYPNQLLGILGGVKGAAEYESELTRAYPRFKSSPARGLKMMGPQTMAHIVVMAFIVIGNVLYFRHQRGKGDK